MFFCVNGVEEINKRLHRAHAIWRPEYMQCGVRQAKSPFGSRSRKHFEAFDLDDKVFHFIGNPFQCIFEMVKKNLFLTKQY